MKKKPYSIQMERDSARPTFGRKSPVMAKSEDEPRRKKGRSASRRQKIAVILSKARKGK